MNPQEMHDRCSEDLRAHVEGSLDPARSAEVHAHLATCAECRSEQAALVALLAPIDEVMTELEAARLHAAVRAALPETQVIVSTHPTWSRRVAPFLGAAATFALLAVGAAQVLNGGSGQDTATLGAADSRSAEQGGGEEKGPEEAPSSEGAGSATTSTLKSDDGAAQPQPDEAKGDSADDAVATETTSAYAYRSLPVFKTLGTTDNAKLSKLAATKEPFTSFAQVYAVGDADELRQRFVGRLALQSGSANQDQVRECSEVVFDTFQNYSFLPAYGARAKLDGQEALILGFVWSEEKTARLNDYQMGAWPKGQCENTLLYRSGKVEP
jgi:hypothetical protein